MSKIELVKGSCAEQHVDAVVNAANRNLWSGGGICGVIFKKAGYTELNCACEKYKTPLKDGDAIITPSFNMKNCKYIIHSVGPDFGQTPNAFQELYDALTETMDYYQQIHSNAKSIIEVKLMGINRALDILQQSTDAPQNSTTYAPNGQLQTNNKINFTNKII